MLKAPVIFYHLWPVGEWQRIHQNLFGKIVSSGLSKTLEKVYICVNTDIAFSEIPLHGVDTDKVEFLRIKDTQSEWPTIQALYDKYVTTPDVPILYFHCKGARFVHKDNSYYAINSWVEGLTYFNITKWRKCINHLSYGKPSVGIKVVRLPVAHYSGNFWWINSSSLKLLADPKTQDQSQKNRHGAEFWIGRLGISNLFDMDMSRTQFSYNNVIDPRRYMNMDRSERSVCIYKAGNQDTSWASRLGVDFDIYQKNSNLKNDSKTEAYVRYIVDNYEDLPQYTFFLSSSSIINIHNLEQVIKNQYKIFHAFGRTKTRDNYNGSPNHPGLPIKAKWNALFSTECPELFDFTTGTNFGVSKGEILKYSKDFYNKILENIENKDNPVDDYCFERMWEAIFTRNNKELQTLKPISNKTLNVDTSEISIFSASVDNEYSDLNVIALGDDSGQYWNIINDNLALNTLVFLSKNVNYTELKELIDSNFKLNNRVESQYLEFNFATWNAIVINKEILIKNKNKKKTFVEPFVDSLSKKLLLLSNGS